MRAAARNSQVADRIHFTGFVDDEELRRLYGACDLFVYPSLYEGFRSADPGSYGLRPRGGLLQHFRHARSRRFGGAALRSLFPAGSLVFAMRDLLLNPELRQRMERLGSAAGSDLQLDLISAAKTLDMYYAVAGGASKAPAAVRKSGSVVRR